MLGVSEGRGAAWRGRRRGSAGVRVRLEEVDHAVFSDPSWLRMEDSSLAELGYQGTPGEMGIFEYCGYIEGVWTMVYQDEREKTAKPKSGFAIPTLERSDSCNSIMQERSRYKSSASSLLPVFLFRSLFISGEVSSKPPWMADLPAPAIDRYFVTMQYLYIALLYAPYY